MSQSKSPIDPKLVKELAAILKDADLGEIEVEHGDLRVRVSRPAAPAAPQTLTHFAAPPPAAPAVAAPTSSTTPTASAPESPAAPSNAITSPMVGTVYLSPEPGAAAFVKVGDTVKKGDTLMLIEAMKTFNPVIADKAGKVSQIIANDAQPVEYGEPLIVIE